MLSRRAAGSAYLAMVALGREKALTWAEVQRQRSKVSSLAQVVVAVRKCLQAFRELATLKHSEVSACALAWVEEAQNRVPQAFACALASELGAVVLGGTAAGTAALRAAGMDVGALALRESAACVACAPVVHRVPVVSQASLKVGPGRWGHAAADHSTIPSLRCWSYARSSSPISCQCQESRPAQARC